MNKETLNTRDLITLGIFNAIAIVCYALTITVSCSVVFGLFFSTAVAFLVIGTFYMLVIVKIRKRGAYLICGIIMSFIGLIGGRIGTTIGCIAGGLIAEILVGNYKSFKRIVMAYAGYAVGVAAGIYFPVFIWGIDYMMKRGGSKGVAPETIQTYASYLNFKFLIVILLVNILAAVIGALIGRKILNKHFVKAGLIK